MFLCSPNATRLKTVRKQPLKRCFACLSSTLLAGLHGMRCLRKKRGKVWGPPVFLHKNASDRVFCSNLRNKCFFPFAYRRREMSERCSLPTVNYRKGHSSNRTLHRTLALTGFIVGANLPCSGFLKWLQEPGTCGSFVSPGRALRIILCC